MIIVTRFYIMIEGSAGSKASDERAAADCHKEFKMKKNVLTTAEIRLYNKSQIYKAIYHNGQISKQEISHLLHLSLPTVSQNLTELQEEKLVEIGGISPSTGGRKPQLYRCIADAQIAFGVSILKNTVQIVSVDLNGTILFREQHNISFENVPSYFQQICEAIEKFIVSCNYDRSRILGIGIAMQGLVSRSGDRMIFGKILHNSDVVLEHFTRYLDYPCILLHDAEAAADYELWKQSGIKDAAFILLNRNLGGSLILNGSIHTGPILTSGIFEHMCLVPHGKLCYCGQHGCVESYCSADSLASEAGMPLDAFFQAVRSGQKREAEIWDTYLHHLALAINNILMVVNCDIILGGLLSSFIQPEDIETLRKYVLEKSAFEFFNSYLMSKSTTNDYAEATGAALHYIRQFLDQV